MLSDFEKVLIALFCLAIVAVFVGSGQTQGFITVLGNFLVAMVRKINGAAQ